MNFEETKKEDEMKYQSWFNQNYTAHKKSKDSNKPEKLSYMDKIDIFNKFDQLLKEEDGFYFAYSMAKSQLFPLKISYKEVVPCLRGLITEIPMITTGLINIKSNEFMGNIYQAFLNIWFDKPVSIHCEKELEAYISFEGLLRKAGLPESNFELILNQNITSFHNNLGSALVFESADLFSAAQSIVDSIGRVRQIYVQESVMTKFGKILENNVKKEVLGDYTDKTYGCLKVNTEKAEEKSGSVNTVVLKDRVVLVYTETSSLIFGNKDRNLPLLLLTPFRTTKEGISLYNNHKLSEEVQVFTESSSLFLECKNKLEFDYMYLNNPITYKYFLPITTDIRRKKCIQQWKDFKNKNRVYLDLIQELKEKGLIQKEFPGIEGTKNESVLQQIDEQTTVIRFSDTRVKAVSTCSVPQLLQSFINGDILEVNKMTSELEKALEIFKKRKLPILINIADSKEDEVVLGGRILLTSGEIFAN